MKTGAVREIRHLRRTRTSLEEAARTAVPLILALMPGGHDGDEESGEHYDDCQRCEAEAAIAMIEAVLEVI